MKRADLATKALRLRAGGMTARQIADQLGISRSYAALLYSDPDGSKERRRKDGYRQPCPSCGALMNGSDGRGSRAPVLCRECSRFRQHQERYWTPMQIIESIRAFAETHGRPPTAYDGLIRQMPDALPVPIVQREFGSWANAIEAAGFPRPLSGTHEVRDETRALMSVAGVAWTPDLVLAAIRRWAEVYGKPPTCGDWQRAGEWWPSRQYVANVFGSWNTAIAAAGFVPRRAHREKVAA